MVLNEGYSFIYLVSFVLEQTPYQRGGKASDRVAPVESVSVAMIYVYPLNIRTDMPELAM